MYARKLGLWLALAVLGLAPAAHAVEDLARESPRNWVLDVQLGSYFPSVDENVSGTPFADFFGGSSLITQLSLQRYLYEGIGTLGLGLQVGYSEFFGRTFISGTDERSGDPMYFRVVPIQLFAAYRFDYAALHWGIPFVLHGRAGIGEWIWWESGPGSGSDDSGAKLGLSASAGLAFHLDWVDPKLAREFDRNFGVNNTYVFVEYTWWNAKFRGNFFRHGFEARGLDLSDEFVSGGIAFEF